MTSSFIWNLIFFVVSFSLGTDNLEDDVLQFWSNTLPAISFHRVLLYISTTCENLQVREESLSQCYRSKGVCTSEDPRSCVADCYLILLTFANRKISIRRNSDTAIAFGNMN